MGIAVRASRPSSPRCSAASAISPGRRSAGWCWAWSKPPWSGCGGSTYRDAIAFAVLILILLLRPNGLLGSKQAEKV